MRKVISVILTVTLLFTILIPAVNAAKKDKVYPTIIVAGYASSSLYKKTEEGTKKVWQLDTDSILSLVLHNIAQIGIGLGELAFNKTDYIVGVVGQGIVDLCGDLACNPDSSSVNNIVPYSQSAEDNQFSYLYRELDGEEVHEPEIMATVAEQYGRNGNDNIFCFQHDFRQSIVDSAQDLDRFIDDVLAFTGSDKVNIFAVSQGGQITAAYLSLYGTEKCVVNNAVLTVPAIGGAALAYDVMSETIVFDEETLLYFIENGLMLETDFNWLVRANQFGILDDICNSLVHNYIKQILEYWGSIWDFIPAEYYTELKNTELDYAASASLIEKSDYYHNEILPNMNQNLTACVNAGINVYIVAGTDNPSVTGLQENSDGIITVKDSTGATTAPYGQRFSDGYQTVNKTCTDETHNHLSPAMTIDASTAYLPEYTWFISGMFHGMTWKDDYAIQLCCRLLMNNTRLSVHDDAQFPQFKYSVNRCHSVIAYFNASNEGYISENDNRLVIKNLSYEYPMRLISVSIDGVPLTVETGITYLKPLETVALPVKGNVTDISLTTASVTVNYKLPGSVTPYGCRTQVFTVLNGDAPEYDAETPFTDATVLTQFEQSVDNGVVAVLEKIGLLDWIKMVFNALYALLTNSKSVK